MSGFGTSSSSFSSSGFGGVPPFGGGGGSQPPTAATTWSSSGFQQQTQHQQQQLPGSAPPFSGFGTTSAAPAAPFGLQQQPSASQNQPFLASSSLQPPSLPFGGSSAITATTTSGFGGGAGFASSSLAPTPALFGTSANTTAPATAFAGTGLFGASSSTSTVAAPAFGTPTATTFAAPASSVLTYSSASAVPFATSASTVLHTATAATPFGMPPSSSMNPTTFQPSGSNITSSSNPFGPPATPAASSGLSFGVSSNVVSNPFATAGFGVSTTTAPAHPPPPATPWGGGGSGGMGGALTPAWFPSGGGSGGDWDMGGGAGGGGGGADSTSPTPFATAGLSPLREASMDDDVIAAPSATTASASNLFPPNPFQSTPGTTTTATTTADPVFRAAPSSSSATTGFAPAAPWSSAAAAVVAPAPSGFASTTTAAPFAVSHSTAVASTSTNPFSRSDDGPAALGAVAAKPPRANDDDHQQRDRLERLKSKLEEKKRKLQERQQQQQQQQQQQNASPVPPSQSSSRRTNSPVNELAQRNALRFAGASSGATPSRGGDASNNNHNSNNATHRFLPDDLKEQASAPRPAPAVYSSQVAPTEREDLSAAVSLVGTCPFMCPEEELLRRQREGDVQLLELPHPELYGPRTTLRDTAVKRFRRSAADYKLDVPEWVRPPDVLERVCSYLEEWVMERDRQGPDPRFPQNGTPPPLDVYQFIWDRTRMIRKDFILQNYVGTGGNCDARAVRCHERIARWHAMCEHQLSHLHEFVTRQSQQNIQELGQTMKTLNQYYDDALGRATVEVADENGKETLYDLNGITHGCAFDTVQGKHPVDYDGTVLDNEPNSTVIGSRRIGKQAAKRSDHGTSEPEMRGLYIVLTIDNDGGMEVLKYAAHLYQRSPDVYHSKPVQLALSIYKAKKEDNYARFFSILRSPETPYLFACIMLKYVELMRKSAFRIMSRTYGGRSKENEAIYDAYPLKSLARLLCFETLDEAREACKHYSITVKPTKVRTSSGTSVEEIVFWRQSSFCEPRDPDKGTLILLPPQKMLRTIERKLNGATRLAVCRGQVSGDCTLAARGNAIPSAPLQREASIVDPILSRDTPSEANHSLPGQDAKFDELLKRQMEFLRKETEEDALRVKEDAQRRKIEEEQRLLQREKELAIQESKRREIARLQQQELEERERQEALRLKAERERYRIEQEREVVRQQAIEADRLRKLEEDKLKVAMENERRERERIMKEEEDRKRKVEIEKRRLKAEKAERLRQEEAQRQEAQLQRRLEEERRVAQQWATKSDESLKKLLWLLWERKYPRRLSIEHSALDQIPDLEAAKFPSMASAQPIQSFTPTIEVSQFPDLSRWERLLSVEKPLNLSRRVMNVLPTVPSRKIGTVLLTVSVYIPMPKDLHQSKVCELILMWVSSCLGVNQVSREVGEVGEVRVAVIDGSNLYDNTPTDLALVVLPPPRNDSTAHSHFEEAAHSITSAVDSSVASVILSLCEVPTGRFDPIAMLTTHFDQCMVVECDGAEDSALKAALASATDLLASGLVATSFDRVIPLKVMDRFSATQLGLKALRATVLADDSWNTCAHLLDHAYISLGCLVDVLDEFAHNPEDQSLMNWPNVLFSDDSRVVADYFGKGIHLPLDWRNTLRAESVEPYIADLCATLSGTADDVMGFLLFGASHSEVEECRRMIERRLFRQYFLHAIGYRELSIELEDDEPCVYLPRSMVGIVFSRVVQRFVAISEAAKPKVQYQAVPQPLSPCGREAALGETEFIETIDVPPEETPIQIQPVINGSSKRERPHEGDATDDRLQFENDPPYVKNSVHYKRRRSTGPSRSYVRTPSSRSRATPPRKPTSRNVKDSKAFTRRLQDLAGGGTRDLLVGHVPLSILLQEVPNLVSDDELRRKLKDLDKKG